MLPFFQRPGRLIARAGGAAPVDPPTGDPDQVTTLTVRGTGAPSGSILRFGIPLAAGDVASGTSMVLRQVSD